MENNLQSESTQQSMQPQGSSFQSASKPKNSGSKWLIIFISLLILGGAGIFFFTKSSSKPIPTPTPSFGVVPIDTEIVDSTPEPTSSPTSVVKDEVSIEVLNGTGIPGEAKFLSDKLTALGYTDVTAGNATTTDNTATTVTFLKTLSQTVQDEIKKELESTYKTVTIKTSSTQKSDVVIITGLRGSQTAKPASTSTPASSSASPSASASPAN